MTGFPQSPTDLSEVFYNGFRFPPALSSNIRSTPVYDDSNRQVIYVTHLISIEFILHAGVDAPYESATYNPVFPADNWEDGSGALNDASLLTLREILTTPGGHLVVNNIGFGGTRFAPALDVLRDANYGPKPSIVEWNDIAGGRAIRVKWQCEVSITEESCSNNTSLSVLVHNATQSWDISESGTTTRRTHGYIVIRSNTKNAPTFIGKKTNSLTSEEQDSGTSLPRPRRPQIQVLQTADFYRSHINYPPLPGFSRKQKYNLSLDKTRLEYEFLDTEIDSQNPYYPGTVSMDGTQRTTTNNFAAGVEWETTISATVKLQKNRHFYWAWVAYAKIVERRLETFQAKGKMWSTGRGAFKNRQTFSGKSPPHFIGRRFSFEESLFEPSFRFSITFKVVCDRNFIFQAMGAGDKVYGTNQTWQAWLNEMRQAHDIRGLTGLVFDTRTDVLFGLCDTFSGHQENLQLRNPTTPGVPESEKKIKKTAEYEKEQQSWIKYDVKVKIIEKTSRIPHYLLDKNEYPSGVNNYPAPISPNASGVQGDYTNPKKRAISTGETSQLQPIIHARQSTKYLLEVSGSAERLGYAIGQPVMLRYAGVDAYPVGDLEFQTSERRDMVNNNLITRAFWRQTYQLARRPKGEWPQTDAPSTNWA